MNRPQAYVELTFHQEDKDYFSNIVKELVPEDKLYHSPVMSHIKGDVTDGLHCTLFFGLTPSAVYDNRLKEILKGKKFPEIGLGGFKLMRGYQDLYKILTIEVMDESGDLTDFSEQMQRYSRKSQHYVFMPHLTLAYVTQDYELPAELPNVKQFVDTDQLQISLQGA